jgi:hypothetical protein
MGKISIILIIGTIVLLVSTSLIFADPPDKNTKEVRKENMKIEHEGMEHEHGIKKEERKHLKEVERERRKYMMIMYIWSAHKYR